MNVRRDDSGNTPCGGLTRSRVFAIGCGGGNGNRFTRKILDRWAEGFNGKAFNSLTATIKKHDIVAVVGLFVLVGRGLAPR
jgi:hypothetical protein